MKNIYSLNNKKTFMKYINIYLVIINYKCLTFISTLYHTEKGQLKKKETNVA